jgi:aminoglycoside phosphotransferase (APT) family kinase protein
MTVTSTPPGIPSASRLAGWIGATGPSSLTRAEFASGYARRGGRDISRIGYYVALGYFKLAVVPEGIYTRYRLHQTVGDGFEHEGLAVPTLVARAHQVLDADD